MRESLDDNHGRDRTPKEKEHYLIGTKPGVYEVSGHHQWKAETQSGNNGDYNQKQGNQRERSLGGSELGSRKTRTAALTVFQSFDRIDPTSRTVHMLFGASWID